MATMLDCISCGAKVKKKEIVLGRAKSVSAGACLCPECARQQSQAETKPRGPRPVVLVLLGAIALGLAGAAVGISLWHDRPRKTSQRRAAVAADLEAARREYATRMQDLLVRMSLHEPGNISELDAMIAEGGRIADDLNVHVTNALEEFGPGGEESLRSTLDNLETLRVDYLRLLELRLDDDSIDTFEATLTLKEKKRMRKQLEALKRRRDTYRRLQKELTELQETNR